MFQHAKPSRNNGTKMENFKINPRFLFSFLFSFNGAGKKEGKFSWPIIYCYYYMEPHCPIISCMHLFSELMTSKTWWGRVQEKSAGMSCTEYVPTATGAGMTLPPDRRTRWMKMKKKGGGVSERPKRRASHYWIIIIIIITAIYGGRVK